MSSSELRVTECSSLGFSSLESGFIETPNFKLESRKLMHSVTSNSELLIEQFVNISHVSYTKFYKMFIQLIAGTVSGASAIRAVAENLPDSEAGNNI